MLLEVNCKVCESPHFDHYECSECKANLGFLIPIWKYCPFCGSELTKPGEMRNDQHSQKDPGGGMKWMDGTITVPAYRNTLSIRISGSICEHESGYVKPEEDQELISVKKALEEYLQDNYWKGEKVQGYCTISSEIVGPDSSSYPNYLIVLFGTYWEGSEQRLKKLLEQFLSKILMQIR